jgi:ribosomal protein L17
MKIRKILLSMLTVVATGAIVATTVTACGVSQDIINNLVTRGDGSKFSNNVSLEQAIKTALTNKDATDAFKKSVVNKLFFN